VTNRRSFLGAVVALVAAPFAAKAEPKSFVTTWSAHPITFERFDYVDVLIGARERPGVLYIDQDQNDQILRSAARLRAIRRFA